MEASPRPFLAVIPAYSLPLPSQGGVSARKEETRAAGVQTPATISLVTALIVSVVFSHRRVAALEIN